MLLLLDAHVRFGRESVGNPTRNPCVCLRPPNPALVVPVVVGVVVDERTVTGRAYRRLYVRWGRN